jgi:hypothetical protein
LVRHAKRSIRATAASQNALHRYPSSEICPNAKQRVALLAFQADFLNTTGERDGGQQEEARRVGSWAYRIERALRGRLLVEEVQDHVGQTQVRRQESGTLREERRSDRARIAVSQPYEVGYWSKKFKVTPAG